MGLPATRWVLPSRAQGCGMNPSCEVASCGRSRKGPGRWCELHYRRQRRFGDPNHLTPRMRSRLRIAAFWEEATAPAALTDGPCMEWPGSRNPKGYGQAGGSHATGESLVSRAAWALVHGPIPDGLCVLHRCDNPPCARPAHLFLGTSLDNMRDMLAKGREARIVGDQNHKTVIPDSVVEDIRRRWLVGASCKELAAEVGVHPATVSRICRGERRVAATPVDSRLIRSVPVAPRVVAPRKKRPLTETELAVRAARQRAMAEMLARIIDLYSQGLSTIQVGREVGLDSSTVYRRLAAAGVPIRSTGDYHPAPDVAAMVARYTAGAGLHDLAREFRVTSQRAAALVRGTGTPIRRPGRPSSREAS